MSKEFNSFSRKQMTVLNWWCEESKYKDKIGIICDGAVRSGKTLCMTLSFVLWAFYRFADSDFAICGKTITSLRRNVITPILPILHDMGFTVTERRSANVIYISHGGVTNRFYLFGGRDESSSSLIQGITLSGVMLDEVALMPKSFTQQAIARCSVSGSRLWFNCNPENPHHWFYKEWIKKCDEKNCLYIHFLMDDNPSLTEEIRERYRKLYSGAFYERFIEGRWVSADGLVYPFFKEGVNTYSGEVSPFSQYYISCDYGTVNPFSMGLWGEKDGVWYRISEFYHDSRKSGFQMTDSEYYGKLCELADGRKITAVIVDPSAASFIECIRRGGKFKVIPAKNDVAYGIRKVSEYLKEGKIKINSSCTDAIREFALYRWDESAGRDAPRKENDHAMDDIRYFVTTHEKTEGGGFFALSAPRNERRIR